jgi:hypothetical protein
MMIEVHPPVKAVRIVLLDDRTVFYNPARTTAAAALDAYESDVDLFFQRPNALRQVRTYPARGLNEARIGC